MDFCLDPGSRGQRVMAAAVLLLLSFGASVRMKAQDPCGSPVNPPGDVALQLATKGGQTVFREGEIIALEAAYTSSSEGRYFANTRSYDRSGRLDGEEIFCLEPDTGSDPLTDYFQGSLAFMGGGLFGMQKLGTEPYVVALELNEWKTLPPGSYRLRIVSNRVTRPDEEHSTPFGGQAVAVVSNEVSFEVTAPDQGWQGTALAEAVQTLDTAKPDSEEAKHAARVLRFLRSEGAARELVKRYWAGDAQPYGWELKFGLFGSPFRSEIVAGMKAAIRDGQHPVTEEFIRTLAVLEVTADPKQKLGPYDPAHEEEWRSKQAAHFAAIDKLVAEYEAEAAAAVLTKSAQARAVTASELLEAEVKLSPAQQVQLKQMVAAGWDTLPVQRQNELLAYRWNEIGGPDMMPILRRIAAEEPGQNRRLDKPDRGVAVQRIYELDPGVGRGMILAEIAHVHGDMGMDVLGMLPEKELPQVEAAVMAELNRRDVPDTAYEVVDRYFSARALKPVEQIYEAQKGNWDCRQQSALLRYFLRVSPEYGVGVVKDAAAVQGTGCWRQVLTGLEEMLRTPKVEQVAIQALNDPRPEAARDAAEALGKFGSAKSEAALWTRMVKFHQQWKDREEELHYRVGMTEKMQAQAGLEQELVQAITNGQAWLATEDDIGRLRELVSPNEQQQLDNLLPQINQGIHVVNLTFWPEGSMQYSLDRFTGKGMAALKEKLAEFPAGTRFEGSTTAAERSRHAAEFAELEEAAAADGLVLNISTQR